MKNVNYAKAINEFDENELERLFYRSKTEDKKLLISLLEINNTETQRKIKSMEEKIEYANFGLEVLNEKVDEIIRLNSL